ncbi:GDSL esterase/lipase At5g03610-like [Phragmites australis]|uniref:GDSL esterase/lipase At5g03610-like n=1 Tax=Phragmites australis TaxID=29695 RepID=UPI002D784E0B|nr:GDSL esterase/lipase At5g03610-like [Phragmites australis]
MKLLVILPVVCFLIVLNAAHVESKSRFMYQMLVFGDSYADTGNIPKSDLSQESRQWYSPYGRLRPSGRLSDGKVQSDFIAMLLGRSEGPPTYRLRSSHYVDMFGMNFAFSGSGVFEVPQKVPTLREQVDYVEILIKEGTIKDWRLKDTVALVAISGNDYVHIANMSSSNETIALVGNVTTEIAKEVKRLQDLGVPKILVNNLHPLGCTPRHSRPNNYARCDDRANMVASMHNKNLAEKLGSDHENVMLLDLNTAFSNLVQPSPDAAKNPSDYLAKAFTNKLRPSCESYDPKGYCGQEDENGHPQYSLSDLDDDPFGNFYWDDVHPTHTGWYFVMLQMQDYIKDFLDI